MVTSTHESLHRFFRDHPEAITPAFQCVGMANFPEAAHVRLLPNDLTEIKPLERRVDTAMQIEPSDGQPFILAFESQGRVDEAKRRSWPYYLEYLHNRYRCPVVLVVLCQNPATATWARRPLCNEATFWTSRIMYPFVLSPDNVPLLGEIDESQLLLRVFSAVIHGPRSDGDGLFKLAQTLKQADPETCNDLGAYVLLGLGSLPIAESWRKMLSMDIETLRTSPVFAEMLDEHDRKVTADAAAQGLARGMAQGMAEAKVETILRILEKRSIELAGSEKSAILGCADRGQLDAWIDAALFATSARDLFREPTFPSDTP